MATVKRGIVLFAVALLFATAFAGVFLSDSVDASDEKYAQPNDISVSPSMNNLQLNAGDTVKIYLDIVNNFDRELVVYVYYTNSDPDIVVNFPNGHRVQLDKGEIKECEMDITIGKYAKSTDHALSFDITINDPKRGFPIPAEASNSLMITVSSELSSGEQYNKILGFIDNRLPAPLNGSIVSAAITLFVWIFIAIVVAYFILPAAISTGKKAGEKVVEDGVRIKRRIEK